MPAQRRYGDYTKERALHLLRRPRWTVADVSYVLRIPAATLKRWRDADRAARKAERRARARAAP